MFIITLFILFELEIDGVMAPDQKERHRGQLGDRHSLSPVYVLLVLVRCPRFTHAAVGDCRGAQHRKLEH